MLYPLSRKSGRLLLIVLLSLAGIGTVSALDVSVTQLAAGGGNYRTIQDALTAVAQAGGGTVTVADSATYAENIPTGTAAWEITVQAATGQTPTLQVGTFTQGYWESFFYMQGAGQKLTVDGFKVDVQVTAAKLDGKLVMTAAADQVVTIRNCIMTGLVNRFLLRMDGMRPSFTLSDCRFLLAYDGTTYIESGLVGMVADDGVLALRRCTYVQNPNGRSPLYYGVIWADHSNPKITLQDSIFVDRSSAPQPVVHIWSSVVDKGSVTLSHCNYPAGLGVLNLSVTPIQSQTLNPGLLDPVAGNFQLNGNSPCIGAGSDSATSRNMGWDQNTAFTATAKLIREMRSVTYYPFPTLWGSVDLDALAQSLDQLKALGGNTVWFVVPWYNFQVQALPGPTWNNTAVVQLEKAVGLAEQRGLTVILPLCYLGVGWAPRGIDPQVWTVDSTMYGAFKSYAKSMLTKLSAHKNMLFLLYTEGSEPYYDQLRSQPLYATSFKTYCQEVNSNIAYWNSRWGTNYTWDTIVPASVPWEGGLRTVDHYRWVTWIMRQTHGQLAAELQTTLGNNLIGFHDYLYSQNYVDSNNTPIPAANPYDVMSVAHYYDANQAPDVSNFESELRSIIAQYAEAFPQTPLVFGETGACDSQTGQQTQADVVELAASLCLQERVGVNFWMWQDFTAGDACQRSFGMLDVSGYFKPSGLALRRAWLSTVPQSASRHWELLQ